MTKRGWVLFLALGLVWGMPYLLIRIAVEDLDPLIVAFGRTLIGALLLLPVAWQRDTLGPAFKAWRWLVAFTLIEISVPWLLLGHAERHLNSSTAALLVAVAPLMAAVIMSRLGHEHLELRRLIGLCIGFAGVAALVGMDVDLSDFMAVGAVLITALCYAVGPIIIDRKLAGVPPLGVITVSLVLATVLYAPFAPWLWPSHVTAPAAWSVVGLGVLCTALAFILFFALIAEVGPSRATVITYLNPAVAIVLGVLVLAEPLTLGMALGFPLVIAGSMLGTAHARRARLD